MSESAPAASESGRPAKPGAPKTPARSGRGTKDVGFFGKIARFVRQVIAELKKVVTPTRQELIRYSTVVIVFVAVVMTFITLIDLVIGRLTFWVFGG